MTTVLIGWELGAGLGHVMRASAFARAFATAGCEVVVAMPDLAVSTRVPWPANIRIVPAPQARTLPLNFTDPSSYAELLFGCGYHDANQVAGLVTGWFNLIDLAGADVLVADHAPSAHLAARVAGVPGVRIGTGFFAPPSRAPQPCFRDWQQTDAERASAIEKHVLAQINAAIEACGLAPATVLGEVLHPDLDLIASWPELDCFAHLRPPGSAVYIGNESIDAGGIKPVWPQAGTQERRRVAVYLKADHGATETVLALLGLEYDTVAYLGGQRSAKRAEREGEHLWIAPEPVSLIDAAQQCDVLVCHAGAGTAPVFLAAGKPVLLLPYSAEQRVNAAQLAATGAALWLLEQDVASRFSATLSDLVNRAEFKAAAERTAARWSGKNDAVSEGVLRTLSLVDALQSGA